MQEKGISTITQLSYGYRPRRRRRVKRTAPRGIPPVRHDHKLKALAIKKAQTHVVGSPSLSIEGTPVFMDVEGMPDRDFYYLIGLRYEAQGVPVEHSFWADRPENECQHLAGMPVRPQRDRQPSDCALRRLRKPLPQAHEGAVEASAEDAEFARSAHRWVGKPSGQHLREIYFPTYSNSLKDIARWLGFEWTWPQASGNAAMLLRRCWELTFDDELQRELIMYNIEDCRAAAVVAEALARICGTSESGGETKLETVNVGSLEVGFQRTFGKFPSALPEFERINAAAYWDYQRSKVYVRTNKAIRRSIENELKPVKKVTVEKEYRRGQTCVPVPDAAHRNVGSGTCPTIIFDLKFTRRGIKRWAVRYRYNSYRCGACRAERTIFQSIQNMAKPPCLYRLSSDRDAPVSSKNSRTHRHRFQCVDYQVHGQRRKVRDGKKYEPTYRQILEQIRSGPLVHADETKGVVYGGGHYVWIFANLTSVAYVYSPSREASIWTRSWQALGRAGERFLWRIRRNALPAAEMPDPSDARYQRGRAQAPLQRGADFYRHAIRCAASGDRRNHRQIWPEEAKSWKAQAVG